MPRSGGARPDPLLEDQGDAQTALSYDNIQQSSREEAETSSRMVTGPQPCTFFWYMDTRAPEWESIEVRKALGCRHPQPAAAGM